MRLHRALLRLYPASFRHEYGTEMVRLFAERRHRATSVERLALWPASRMNSTPLP